MAAIHWLLKNGFEWFGYWGGIFFSISFGLVFVVIAAVIDARKH